MSEKILIAEDEEVVRVNLQEFLESKGYVVECVADGHAALARLLEDDFALAVADIRMPRLSGIDLLEQISAKRPRTRVVIMTAYASVETAVESLRLGAYDYLLKPIVFEDLLQCVRNLFEFQALQAEVVRLRRVLTSRLGFEGMVGDSPAIRAVFELVDRVAPTRTTVLITGESGTGKELVARAIHSRSAGRDKEFLPINMAGLPHDLVEAQLFGHEKGAFTGADRSREGLLRSVKGGTVFLDEVGEIPLPAQAKLLRALEAQEILPVGATRPLQADFRLIAATNRDLEESIEEGSFRRDLFFRLNVLEVAIPPLRERREDVQELVNHFVSVHSRTQGKAAPDVSSEAMRLLLSYPWPGNVRELSNVVERACILCEGDTVEERHLPAELLEGSDLPMGLKRAVEAFEARHIAWVLRSAGGNRERAARLLEVDQATLYRRLSKYGPDAS